MVNIFLKIHAALVSFIGFLALLSEVKHLFFKGQYCSDQVRPHNCCNAQNWHFMRVFTQAPRQCLHCSPVCRKQPEIPHLFCLYMACFFLLSCSFPGFPGTAVQTRAIQSTQHSLPLETGGLALGIGISASTFLVCRCPAICRLIFFFNPGSALILRTFSALVSFFVSCEAFRKAWICYGKPFWGQKIWAPIRKITEINGTSCEDFAPSLKLPNSKRQCSRK